MRRGDQRGGASPRPSRFYLGAPASRSGRPELPTGRPSGARRAPGLSPSAGCLRRRAPRREAARRSENGKRLTRAEGSQAALSSCGRSCRPIPFSAPRLFSWGWPFVCFWGEKSAGRGARRRFVGVVSAPPGRRIGAPRCRARAFRCKCGVFSELDARRP